MLNNIKQCLRYINSVDIRNCKIEIIQNLIQSYENGDEKNRCVIREMVSNMEVNLKLLFLLKNIFQHFARQSKEG
jgi:hypothetical protein